MKLLQTFLLFFSFTLTAIYSQSPVSYADPQIGTAPTRDASALRHSDHGSEETGQTFPATGRPFGMTQWTPETRTTERKCISPYYYNDKYITGFRGSHRFCQVRYDALYLPGQKEQLYLYTDEQ